MSSSEQPRYSLETVQAVAAISRILGMQPKFDLSNRIFYWGVHLLHSLVYLYVRPTDAVEVQVYIRNTQQGSETTEFDKLDKLDKLYTVIGYCANEQLAGNNDSLLFRVIT